jgi:hypothetical protein
VLEEDVCRRRRIGKAGLDDLRGSGQGQLGSVETVRLYEALAAGRRETVGITSASVRKAPTGG